MTNRALLRWLQNLQEPEVRMTRWALKLQAYYCEILYCPVSNHQNAKNLSCLPTLAVVTDIVNQIFEKMLSGKYQDDPKTVRQVLDEFLEKITVHKVKLIKLSEKERG